MNSIFWPLSRDLFEQILLDRISDSFVCNLVWERLDYISKKKCEGAYSAGKNTPKYWSDKFPEAPEIIAKRSASVHLIRSIPKQYKQSLKECMDFKGYKIDDLFPRRTRRANAVNWLLAWMLIRGDDLPQNGPLPTLNKIPSNPLKGHPGDPEIE